MGVKIRGGESIFRNFVDDDDDCGVTVAPEERLLGGAQARFDVAESCSAHVRTLLSHYRKIAKITFHTETRREKKREKKKEGEKKIKGEGLIPKQGTRTAKGFLSFRRASSLCKVCVGRTIHIILKHAPLHGCGALHATHRATLNDEIFVDGREERMKN